MSSFFVLVCNSTYRTEHNVTRLRALKWVFLQERVLNCQIEAEQQTLKRTTWTEQLEHRSM